MPRSHFLKRGYTKNTADSPDVHDGRSREVTEDSAVRERVEELRRHVAQPAARPPCPVAEDRVDEARHRGRVQDVALEPGAADHRAGRDRRARVCERELEEPER